MTTYNVHLKREVFLTLADIEADSAEDAASIARSIPTGAADRIDDCEALSARVSLAGTCRYEELLAIDFEANQTRKSAPALLASLEAILPYAEVVKNEAYSLEKHKDNPECEAQAERAWAAIKEAQTAIAQAKASGLFPASIDLDAVHAARGEIAVPWSIEDVQAIRPHFTKDQCWEVLETAKRKHDAEYGISWTTLAVLAEDLSAVLPKLTKRGRHSHERR